jgi:uncharacterized protein (UPF0297 family)
VNKDFDETMMFDMPKENTREPKEILNLVFAALEEKGYDPIDQIIGYILSGDPTYITSYNNARNIIRKIERDELLEDILREYLNCNK